MVGIAFAEPPSPRTIRGSSLITTGDATIGGTLTGGAGVIFDADGVVLTTADLDKMIVMTGPGEVALPDMTAAELSSTEVHYVIVFVRDAAEQVEVVVTDATELIVLPGGTALDAGDEANMPTTAMSMATFVYLETGKWYCTSSNGTVTDGGVAD